MSRIMGETVDLIDLIRVLGFPVAKIQTADYKKRRDEFVSEQIRALEFINSFPGRIKGGGGFDERVVEYPLLCHFIRSLTGPLRMLDIGMTSNNRVVKNCLDENLEHVHFINPSADENILLSVPSQVSEVDFRELSMRPHQYNLITSISTIEHVGFSNSQYGLDQPPEYRSPTNEPLIDLARFIDKFSSKDEASAFITFPVGKRQLNLHPVTRRFGSQTFDKKSTQTFTSHLTEYGFQTKSLFYTIENHDFVLGNNKAFSKRYGQGAVAANSVAVILARR